MSGIQGLRILVVEDEATISMLIEDMLEELGCVVVASIASLAKARDFASSAEFDLAMLDVNVAGELVFPVADDLMARQIPFLFSTGYGGRGLPAAYAHCQVVTKPFSLASLEGKLGLALGGRPHAG